MFKLGSFAFLGLAFATLTLTVDTLCLSAILKNPAIVGQYGIAVTLAMGLMLIPRAITQTALPYLSEQCRDRRRIRDLSFHLILRVGVIMLVVGIFTFALAPWFIPLLFGLKYLPAVAPFKILIPGIFFYSLHNISGTALLALGRTDFNFYVTVIAGSLNILLNIIFIHRYGLIGAAYATSLTYALRLLLSFFFLFGRELNSSRVEAA
jgi:O-antigen/teichoic acid export membrane protein